MFLSKRLATIQEMCPKGVVADIGADHGKLIISLVKNNIASHGFAVENKKGPYERLVAAIEESGFKDKITPIFGDGIEKIPDSVDTLVLAGMGGLNIVSILSKHRNSRLLSSNSAQYFSAQATMILIASLFVGFISHFTP